MDFTKTIIPLALIASESIVDSEPIRVDFRKTFDCISRQKLVDKLRKEGVHGRFFDVLISIYSNYKSAVKIDDK